MLRLTKKFNSFLIILAFLIYENHFTLYAEWSPPVQISSGESSVSPTATPLIINSRSQALAGWLDAANPGSIQTLSSASLYPRSFFWTSPNIIYTNNLIGLFPTYPSMSEDGSGNQIAAFGLVDLLEGLKLLNVSRRLNDHLNWQAPIQQFTNGNSFASSIATDNLGNFATFLAISAFGGAPFADFLFQLPSKSNKWDEPLYLALDNSVQTTVAAKNYQGNGFLAWKVNTPYLQIQTVRFNFINQNYSDVMNVPFPLNALDILEMELALDAHGNAIIVYTALTTTTQSLYASTLLRDEILWSAPVLISNPNHTALNFSIGSDEDGTTTILWTEAISGSQQFVRAATLPLENQTPIFVTNLTSPDLLNTTVETVKVSTDFFGNAAATWSMLINGTPIVQVAAKAENSAWDLPYTLTLSGRMSLIALSDQGTAVVTWIDQTSNVLMGSRNLFLFSLESPTDFSGKIEKNTFATQETYFLKMSWNQSPAPHIINYVIFKNEKIVATLSGHRRSFKKQLNSKQVHGTYYLVAIASNGNRSLPIPIKIR